MELVRLLSVLIGAMTVVSAYFWAMQVLMVKGAEPPLFARLIFRGVHNAMFAIGLVARGQTRRQQIWALYIPVSLLAIVAMAVAEILVGYTLIFYGVSSDDLRTSYINSVSSLSVLGFGGLPAPLVQATIALAEAFTGPIFVALLISNLAAMYSALNQEKRRLRANEAQVGRARSGPDLLQRAANGPGLAALSAIWMDWGTEFERIEATYKTVEGYLLIASPSMHNCWVADVEAVLDAANLRNAALNLPNDSQAARCMVTGAEAIGHTAEHFRPAVLSLVRAQPPRTVTRDQFEEVCTALAAAALPVVADRDAAWRTFQDIRKTYGTSVTDLSVLMHAPTADWP